jgi:hypothetical protein
LIKRAKLNINEGESETNVCIGIIDNSYKKESKWIAKTKNLKK